MASKTIIDDVDFGVSTRILNKMDIFEVPVEMVEAKPDKPKAVKPRMDGFKEKQVKGQAMEAVKQEVLNDGVTFNYNETSYTIPPVDDWDLDIFEAQEDGRLVTAVKLLLGPEQWLKFKPAGAKRVGSDLNGLFEAAQAAMGLNQGE